MIYMSEVFTEIQSVIKIAVILINLILDAGTYD